MKTLFSFHFALDSHSNSYNGGQKSWDLSSDVTKTSDPSPPTPHKVEFGAKWAKMSAFLATTLLYRGGGGGGDDEMNRKPNKNLSIGAGSFVTIAWKGFFTQPQVLLSSIAGTTLQCQNVMALLFQIYIAFTHSLGYPCPDNFNPADFFVRTLAIKPGNEENCRNRVKVGTALFFCTLHSDYFILFLMPVIRPYFLQNLIIFCE